MNVNDMTLQQFLDLPSRERWSDEITCDSLVILPGSGAKSKLHDSGYRTMDFVAVDGGVPICRLSGCSDVIHIEGIGGYGHRWIDKGGVPDMVKAAGWSIDCLAKSGLLQIFCNSKIIAGAAMSSFEIYSGEKRSRG